MTTPQPQLGGSQNPSSPAAPSTPTPSTPTPSTPTPSTPAITIGDGTPTKKGLATAKMLFVVLFGWLILQLFGLVLWAWATYPSNADVIKVAGVASKETAAQAVALRAQWQQSVLGIGTGLAITPMTALLSAVVGYLLHDTKTPAPTTATSTTTPASGTPTS